MSPPLATDSTQRPLPIGIVHYDAESWLDASCRSLLASDIPVSLTIVSNSGPVDITAASILVPSKNLGFAAGANVVINDWLQDPTARRFLVVGAHDLLVEPACFREMLGHMKDHPRVGICAPTMPDAAVGPPRGASNARAWVSGQCMMLRRECIQEIGGFDERFWLYVEDTDLGLRAWDAGWRVEVVASAHARGRGTADIDARRVRRQRWSNQMGLARKRRGAWGAIRLGLSHLLRGLGLWPIALLRLDENGRELAVDHLACLRPGVRLAGQFGSSTRS